MAGKHTLLYRSMDNVGNLEVEQSVQIVVDIQPPTTKAVTDVLLSNVDVRILFNSNDSESGVMCTNYRITREKVPFGEYQTGNEAVILAEEDHSGDGNYTVQYYSVDRLNNTESVKELKVRIDTQVFLQLGFSGTPKVNVNRFTVDGRTEQGARLTINDETVMVASDGSFSYVLGLEPGRNEATMLVTDSAGNKLTKTVFIDYEQPVTGLGWFWAALVGVLVICAVVGGGLFYRMKRKKDIAAAKARKARRPVKKGGKR